MTLQGQAGTNTHLPHSKPYHKSIKAPDFDPRFRREAFSRSSHTGDLNIGAPVAVLRGVWRDKVTGGTG